jgi:transposase
MYLRRVADLPLGSRQFVLQLHVRRFYCHKPTCPRVTFAEKFPDITRRYARRTNQLQQALQEIAFAHGGEAGSRLAKKLHYGISSPDTLLRIIRNMPHDTASTPRYLGVDDWAMRKGRKYGTILVDLERHRVVDLLPDRTSAELARWLKEHSGVELITRDRSGSYSEGAKQGAPHAIQVADRFHLLTNLNETLKQILQRHPGVLKSSTPLPSQTMNEDGKAKTALKKPEPEERASLRQKQELYQRVQQLRQQGKAMREIAASLGIAVNTVLKYASLQEAPQPQVRSTRKTMGYEAFIAKRWNAGTREVKQIFRELQSRGYRGSYQTLARYVANELGSTTRKPHAQHLLLPTTVSVPVSKAAWVLGKPAEKLDGDEKKLVEQLCQAADWVPQTYALAQGFQKMVRQRQADQLETWLTQAKSSSVAGMRNFALGLERDQEAVHMALSSPWSNGQTEGQVSRLKLLKRQMQGRAKLDLLKQRMVHRYN